MIIKQLVGESISLGGKLEDIEPIYFSCYNFNNKFNSELSELSPEFYYFTVTEKDYLYARAKNLHWNWNYSNPDGTPEQRYRRTKMARSLAELRAKKELNDYPEETFIKNNQDFEAHIYTFGAIPKDLYKVSDEVKDEKIVYVEKLEEEIKEENELINE